MLDVMKVQSAIDFGNRKETIDLKTGLKKIYNGETVTVHGNKDNIGSRYYLHARNGADAVLFILKNVKPVFHPDVDRPERFNIVGDVEVDNLALAQTVAKMLNKELKYEFFDFHGVRSGHDEHVSLKQYLRSYLHDRFFSSSVL